jgi:hypothetical protein
MCWRDAGVQQHMLCSHAQGIERVNGGKQLVCVLSDMQQLTEVPGAEVQGGWCSQEAELLASLQ